MFQKIVKIVIVTEQLGRFCNVDFDKIVGGWSTPWSQTEDTGWVFQKSVEIQKSVPDQNILAPKLRGICYFEKQ